ncbi:MAG TPA: hypothetical protein VNY52_13520, partial [Solirubrobacteraceae bacterium]|nr:hypothetical protein [Solirubrobacteraceae bacterium]
GWGGQAFIARSPGKIARLRELLDGATEGATGGAPGGAPKVVPATAGSSSVAQGSSPAALEVDGGVDPATAPLCRAAGATLFVAGSAIFHASEPGAAYCALAHSADAV